MIAAKIRIFDDEIGEYLTEEKIIEPIKRDTTFNHDASRYTEDYIFRFGYSRLTNLPTGGDLHEPR